MKDRPMDISQLRRWHTDLAVLSLLRHQPMHGYGLFVVFQEKGGLEFQMTRHALYKVLHRLERLRWIQGKWEEGLNHREHFVYAVTGGGRKAFMQRLDQWKTFSDTMNQLLKVRPVNQSSGRVLNMVVNPPSKKPKKIRKTETVMEAVMRGSLSHHIPLRKILNAPR